MLSELVCESGEHVNAAKPLTAYRGTCSDVGGTCALFPHLSRMATYGPYVALVWIQYMQSRRWKYTQTNENIFNDSKYSTHEVSKEGIHVDSYLHRSRA
jgi:hypothetical protein